MTVADRTAALVAWWVATYTRHLPAEVAARRRAELASDLWEQRAHGRAVGAPAAAVALSTLGRMAAGIPADLCWRHQQLAAAEGRPRRPGGRHLPRTLAQTWWLVLATLLGALEVVAGIGTALDGNSGVGGLLPGDPASSPRRAAIITAGGLLALWGIAQRRRSRVAGDLLIAVGMLPPVAWLWTGGPAVIVSLLALTVIVAAVVQAAQVRSLGRRGAPLPANDRMLLGNAVVFVAVLAAYTLMDRPTASALIAGLVLLGLLAYVGFRRRRHTP
jgi:LPXTG-motif cell wall-anchored protein